MKPDCVLRHHGVSGSRCIVTIRTVALRGPRQLAILKRDVPAVLRLHVQRDRVRDRAASSGLSMISADSAFRYAERMFRFIEPTYSVVSSNTNDFACSPKMRCNEQPPTIATSAAHDAASGRNSYTSIPLATIGSRRRAYAA